MGAHKTFSLILGIVLVVIGVWGLFTQHILGIFGVNVPHSVLHLIAAACGIYAGTKGDGKSYIIIIGVIGILLAVLGFIPGIKDLLIQFLNIDTGITVLHLIIGIARSEEHTSELQSQFHL